MRRADSFCLLTAKLSFCLSHDDLFVWILGKQHSLYYSLREESSGRYWSRSLWKEGRQWEIPGITWERIWYNIKRFLFIHWPRSSHEDQDILDDFHFSSAFQLLSFTLSSLVLIPSIQFRIQITKGFKFHREYKQCMSGNEDQIQKWIHTYCTYRFSPLFLSLYFSREVTSICFPWYFYFWSICFSIFYKNDEEDKSSGRQVCIWILMQFKNRRIFKLIQSIISAGLNERIFFYTKFIKKMQDGKSIPTSETAWFGIVHEWNLSHFLFCNNTKKLCVWYQLHSLNLWILWLESCICFLYLLNEGWSTTQVQDRMKLVLFFSGNKWSCLLFLRESQTKKSRYKMKKSKSKHLGQQHKELHMGR